MICGGRSSGLSALPSPRFFWYEGCMESVVRILPQTLVNKIAAGEVIVRPASVVKELVENAFDAGARRIRVEVSQDGRSISVCDDGCGMDEENAKRAILRHSTSKIQEFEDLLRLDTRGFRGEALASIISVSRFEMITCPAGHLSGTRLVAAGGKVESVEPVGAPAGTTIHVRDLFYNTPARLKFLKSPPAEFNVLAQILTQQALTHPEIGITCLRGGETRFDLPPDQNLLERAEGLLGPSIRGKMLEVAFERDAVTVRGYICRPEAARKDRRWQYLMVNGRPIAAKQLAYPMQEAYGSLLMTQRYPVVVLQIGLDPAEVDINVHPTKEEVRFEEERKVAGLLHRAISLTLRSHNLMPAIQMGAGAGEDDGNREGVGNSRPTAAGGAGLENPPAKGDRQDPSIPFLFSPQGATPFRPGERILHGLTGPASQPRDMFPPSRFTAQGTPAHPAPTGREISRTAPGMPEAQPAEAGQDFDAPQIDPSPESNQAEAKSGCDGPPVESGDLDAPNRASLSLSDGSFPTVLGQLARTYILADWNNHLLLIDQHAAHERLVYRQLRERLRGEVDQQRLLAPLHIEVPPADWDALGIVLPLLQEMGIDIRRCATGNGCEVRALPCDFDSLDVAGLVQDILDGLHSNASAARMGIDELRDRVQIRMACHAAIRAGQQLHPHEMDALVRQIVEARLSFTCPHGRPTMVLLRKDQLDRQFGRK